MKFVLKKIILRIPEFLLSFWRRGKRGKKFFILVKVKEKEKMPTVNALRGSINILQEFLMGMDWSNYKERMEQYFLGNFTKNDRKVAVLLTVIGEQTYII